ncbi:MAG: HRDC domain-containing protein [Alphaproteobacteria bacterium]|nr:HRDC domain-containing protein [Alphaproteobacteria bacterium]
MQLSLLTLSLDPATGAFPSSPLEQIEGEVVSVVEHFFHHQGLPRLLLIVHHRQGSGPRAQTTRPDKKGGDPRAGLSPDELERFDRLRAWRNGRAETDGIPPYIILSNRELAAVARSTPQTLAELRRVEGIGKAKLTRYGPNILEVLGAKAPEAPADAS